MEVQHENETGREGGAPKSEKEAGAMISNQETEKAAMKKGGNAGSARELESPNEATTTRNQYEENTTKPIKLDGIFAIPATPPNKVGLITKSASSSRSSSLKKQRRGSRGKTNLNVTGTENGVPKSNTGTNSVGNDLMKQSQSMTSLQASNEEQQERRDVIQAKLHLERPYNSLKKNSHSNKMHRYSWGSGNSQCSSTSLHSSATLGLGSSGKDDLWAAIQTNYNYIMDTNLLDTCKEARCEIEGAATVLEKSSECSFKMLDETQRPEGLCEDPKELRRWLREMESKLETSPTITELTLFGNAELQRHLAVHSVLYHEIVSHARVVSSCIRAAEKEQQLQQQQQQQLQLQQQQQQQQLSSQQPASLTSNCSSESTSDSATKSSSLSSGFASDPVTTPTTAIGTTAAAPPPSGSHHPSKKGEGNLERLRDRYHLLYLKAFELQLCLDNLLRKRSSTANGLDDDEDEEEDTEDDSFGYEGEATEDDLNEVNSDLDLENSESKAATPAELILQRCQITATQIVCGLDESHSHSHLQSQSQQIASQAESLSADQPRDCLAPQKPGDEADEELEEEDEDPELGTDVVDFLIAKRSWRQANHPNPSGAATLTDFEADSESSDFEQVQQLSRRGLPVVVGSTRRVLNLIEMPQGSNSNINSSNSLLQQRHHNMLPNKAHNKNIAVAVITPNSHGNTSHGHGLSHGLGHDPLNKSPLGLRKTTRHHHNDTSKFNRSNRKSKNCAIFYFKHLDTDNEQGNAGTGTGTAGSDLQSEDDPPCLIHRRRPTVGAGGDILKSADASTDDDDEGWLYTATAAAAATTLEVATTATATSSAAAAAATSIVDGLQSTAISSTTASSSLGGQLPPSDDSDKENKEALVVSTTTITAAAATTVAIAASHNSSNYDSSSACSSSNSNSNSNGRHTETSATSRVTQLQMQIHSQSQMQMQMQMEFQTNGNASDGRHVISNNNCYSSLQHQQRNNNEGEAAEDHLAKIKMGVDETTADLANGNARKSQQMNNSFYSRADICNISVWPAETVASCHLPPRSPAKSSKSQASSSNATMSASMMLASPAKGKVSHDSIKQLVLEAEHLVRDAQEAALKTPTKQKHSIIKISSTVKKREVTMPHPIKQRVEEWLEHQPSTPQLLTRSQTHELLPGCKPDDCEASGEASETDSVPHAGVGLVVSGGGAANGAGSDTSEGFTDSIATCMQTSTNSYGNSTERIGGSAEPIGQPVTPLGFGSSNQSLNVKIVKRPQTRRKSERPWSVSCLSQLTTDAAQLSTAHRIVENSPPGLASHSISESALDSLSPGPRPRAASSSGTGSNAARKADSKGSLRRRKARKKRISAASAGRKSDSGSELGGDLTQTLMKSCESMSSQQLQEFTNALLSIQKGTVIAPLSPKGEVLAGVTLLAESEAAGETQQLMLPKFRVGSFTTAGLLASETRLGALAALSNYMNEDEQQAELSTEDHHSSISETAWDNYQEKYNSENYSEGFDSDAARRLLEFGDDYRNYIDSQSDCCSSLSAANNLDSFSPPRMDSLQKHELKTLHINQDTITSSVDHARRQRALELQYERRRKTLEVRRKSCQDMDEIPIVANPQKEQQTQPQLQAQPSLSASATALMTTPKNQSTSQQQLGQRTESVGRKLEFGGMSHSAQSLLRRTSESDTSTRRRRTVTADERRRSSRNLEKCIKLIPATTSSSSGSDSEDGEQEMRSLLQQSRDRLDDTRALKIRCHLLRPEDYNEIINTCRDNIRCLEAVLRGPPGTVLSNHCAGQTKDLLAAWEDLLGWSENASAARKLQQEMSVLKNALQRLGDKPTPELLDTEPAIQIAVEALKLEQTQLASYRTNMLRLNASVHSWLTRQERRLQNALEEQEQQQESEQLKQEKPLEEKAVQSNGAVAITVTDSNGNQVEAMATGEASTSTAAWDVHSLMSAEQEFHKHLKNEVSDMYSAWDEADARINTQLEMLTNSLIAWRQLESGLSEFHLALGQDRGTLKGLEGALDKGQATPVELAQNVKLVAKLLSEKVNVSQEQLLAVQQHLDPNHIYHIAKFTASNGSLSDSGISDGGATSDGGLSERERRLGVLRRLAKQLELALAPGSEAMRSIAARMESAEAELKHLQNTCRDLIVRTAASHQQKQQQQSHQVPPKANGQVKKQAGKANGQPQSPGKRGKGARKARQAKNAGEDQHEEKLSPEQQKMVLKHIKTLASGDGGDDPSDDPSLLFNLESSEEDAEEADSAQASKRGWAWRIARAAVPMQVALFTIFCAACLMQPNCCDNLNNLSMSFTPQLRYIRGPPPI
ncbi:klarsicht protein isoform X2 [Drosophila gunungcola]|uniref:klarsicht protein isoform X2 n=1 Tax=Drosophila gunungcola TaxID=103775 RepID=UPI0022E5091F|nr:klarsicht protein isoform X2 [Drosophila gunungcola]